MILVIPSLLVSSMSSPALKAQQPSPVHYKSIEISRFTVEPGANIADDFLIAISNDLTEQLRKTKKFEIVRLEGADAGDLPRPALRLTGVVKEFKPGSRAKRYLIGFGAGKTKVLADVKFIDVQTEQVVYEKEVDGKVVIGVFGGDSMGAAQGLAKEVAKVSKKQFFK
jgi:hypothetical protein